MPDDPQTQKQDRKPRGMATRWSEMDIARMTLITRLDLANAKRWFRKHSVPRYRNVLDSEEKGEGKDGAE